MLKYADHIPKFQPDLLVIALVPDELGIPDMYRDYIDDTQEHSMIAMHTQRVSSTPRPKM